MRQMCREVSEEGDFVGDADETCFKIIVERYKRHKMGDYSNNRLFCVGEIFPVQLMSDGDGDRAALSGLRAYEGGVRAA